jgi:hypothetical protein
MDSRVTTGKLPYVSQEPQSMLESWINAYCRSPMPSSITVLLITFMSKVYLLQVQPSHQSEEKPVLWSKETPNDGNADS